MLNLYRSLCSRNLYSLVLAVFFLFVLPAKVPAQDKSIAVLPFEVHASQDYQHLQKAVPDMFASRVAQAQGYKLLDEARIKALEIDPAQLDRASSLEIGRKTGADLVLYGRLTMLQESWSLDASLLDISVESLLTYSRSGANIQELIPGLEDMAGEMRVALEKDGQHEEKRTAQPDATELRPEKTESDTPYAGFEAVESTPSDLPGAWSSQEMDRNFTGLAAGDLTGDGKTETVLVDEDAVYIYSLEDNKFQLLKKIEAPGSTNCIAVDVGDVNGNGFAEIFVTAQNNRGDMLRSFVLEYQNGQYRTILNKSPWFYKVGWAPNQGSFLLGQRHKPEADPFQAEIVYLEYRGGEYVPGEIFVRQDKDLNLLGLTMGSITGQGARPGAVALDSQDRLMALAPGGGAEWTSRDKYGGSTLYMQGPIKSRGADHERYFLSGRSAVLHKPDGLDQVFTFRNKSLSPISLQRLRVYQEGQVIGLAWDGDSLQEEWQTKTYGGHFRDLVLGDLNNNGRLELAALLIQKEELTVFSRAQTKVLVFPLQAEILD